MYISRAHPALKFKRLGAIFPLVIIHQPKSSLPSVTGVSISWYSWTLSIGTPPTANTIHLQQKKSRYLNRRENARSNCQKFQMIRGSGESEIVQRWKSFKHLNKHSMYAGFLTCIWIRPTILMGHACDSPIPLLSQEPDMKNCTFR